MNELIISVMTNKIIDTDYQVKSLKKEMCRRFNKQTKLNRTFYGYIYVFCLYGFMLSAYEIKKLNDQVRSLSKEVEKLKDTKGA